MVKSACCPSHTQVHHIPKSLQPSFVMLHVSSIIFCLSLKLRQLKVLARGLANAQAWYDFYMYYSANPNWLLRVFWTTSRGCRPFSLSLFFSCLPTFFFFGSLCLSPLFIYQVFFSFFTLGILLNWSLKCFYIALGPKKPQYEKLAQRKHNAHSIHMCKEMKNEVQPKKCSEFLYFL